MLDERAVAAYGVVPMRAYLAVPDRKPELLQELSHAGVKVVGEHERLVLTEGGPKHAAWASNVWLAAEHIPFESISHAATLLRARQGNWALYGVEHYRRGCLIQTQLPHVSSARLRFGQRPPRAPLGSYTLLQPNVLLASAACSSPFPNGELNFEENTTAPPSRAYLKLWELFTRIGRKPKPGQTCLDLGGSPGGWTWVLASLGAHVTSIDKAPLAASVMKLPNVRFRQTSAFALDPAAHPAVDWLFSDVICYPERLLEHVHRWIELKKATHLVCTLKFQGATDHNVAREFAKIPGSRLMHLHNNRHELTWWRLG